MQTQLFKDEMLYDGRQLKPLYAYLEHGILGDSIVAWSGPCEIAFSEMVDGEDLREKAAIRGSKMLHFIVEIFDRELFSAVVLQRLMASLAQELLSRHVPDLKDRPLRRDGDDLYWGSKKLSISIASRSSVSCQIHFAVNISNQGTPVETCALEDWGVEPRSFAEGLMGLFSREFDSILRATRKVRPLGPV